ncbi:hypothetical protein CO115_04295 [Candidatus Falkowbacteria bacterium CG_4_9_14_3_um_filter_36_9]|uniref:Membrane fusion protein biotin-lipoyl like domain-containing protein n=2 Tax=Candidatus Falkowiibacteriota TaxID=1752728 RepID=A0A1J4T930_9BACT|nr:MAG: hypothetical protein AUJ27_02505 [Candidatus Falkowbacteria bacterium CG1_02_37_44]PIV52114.1 MAG: hypothetical protein COS18_00410 [Candidatus Falkowbacteria bacterium CG02_land_8_20_14_3_00_36_14]PJA10920.1 MAG: hypothetical protein COX67_02515 [Candidatus Falkowbacteria bacterium CG_4_10_14_0_2_um_filter_36_22]PJB18543.1 MAG: hypothetical protein CO115_04295 [Candidatus Falkowbacteria bacterium CG_4_9_14_3_um_filter_36_9]
MNFIHKLLKRKIILIIAGLVIIGGGYFSYKKINPVKISLQYITAPVEKGTLAVSVSGTGQVSSSNQVDIKTQVSGKVLKVLAANGQEVETNAVLFQLNAGDALKTVRDAQSNLDSARLSLEKIKKPADALSVLQSENALTSARDSLEKLELTQKTNYQKTQEVKQKAEDNIKKAYEDSFNIISNAFLDLPTIITNLEDVLYGYGIDQSEFNRNKYNTNIDNLINGTHSDDKNKMQSLITSAENDYKTARTKYDQNFTDYKNTDRYSNQPTIESLLAETLETAKSMAQAVKSSSNMLDAWADYRAQRDLSVFSKVTGYQANLSTYIGQTNSHLSSILAQQRTLQDNKEAVINADRDLKQIDQNNPLDLTAAEQSVKEKEVSLLKLKAGADIIDIKSQELTVLQRKNALADARQKLADYTIRAPFAGVIAKINIKLNDEVSAGTAAATLVTKQQVAEISLNEVDVAKIKVGQKVTLTFEALENLSTTGTVAEIDTIGTVTQGVVYYAVKITFDTQDERVKPGMSVSANIITEVRPDVLLVPSPAVKSQNNGEPYVEIMESAAPRAQQVKIGISNDTSTEIISGLKEGDRIVTQTIDPAAASQTTQQQSIFSSFGGGGGGGQLRGVGR